MCACLPVAVLRSFLNDYATKNREEDPALDKPTDDLDAVTVTTTHQAKGLEAGKGVVNAASYINK